MARVFNKLLVTTMIEKTYISFKSIKYSTAIKIFYINANLDYVLRFKKR
jgi:hypothetical protein